MRKGRPPADAAPRKEEPSLVLYQTRLIKILRKKKGERSQERVGLTIQMLERSS